jgi:hypothetical protein
MKKLNPAFWRKDSATSRKMFPKKTPLCLHRAMGKLVAHGKKGKAEDRIAEELVDVILYILDSSSFCMPNRQHG